MVRRSLAQVVVCLSAFSLGCGSNGSAAGGVGGSGGEGGFGGSPAIVPIVTETMPQDMAIDVSAETTVQARFNTVLDAATVTPASFAVRRQDGAPVAGSVALDMTGLVAIFTPNDMLDMATPFTVTLTIGIKSVEGVALGANFSWSFTIRDGAWGVAELIETGETDATAPDVALDPSGNAIAVWSQVEGPPIRIGANRFTPSATWGDPEFISDLGTAGVARVVVDPQGNAVAVWDEDDGMSSNIWANRFTPGVGWDGGQLIEVADGDADAAQIGIDADGNATAVWHQLEGPRSDTLANRFVPDSGWTGAAKIEVNNAGDATFPRLSVSPRGNAMAVWVQSDGTRTNVWANRFTSNAGWENAGLIEQGGGNGASPDVALDSDGDAIAVWSQTDGMRFNIWANRFTRTNRWEGAQLIEAGDAGSANDPRVVIYPRGNAHVVWHQSNGMVTNIWANHFTPETGWGEAQLIETDDAGNADSAQIAVDPKGNAITVWSQSDGVTRSIWANRFTPAAGWGTPQLLEVGDEGDAAAPQVAMNPAGRGIAIWSYYDGARSGIWVNRFE